MAGNLFVLPKQVPIDVGVVVPGAKLTFTQTGTATPQNTYTDVDLTVASSNPVVADANGIFEPIYLDPALPDYRVLLTDSDDVTIYQVDDIPAAQAGQNLTLQDSAPYIDFIETDAAADNQLWRLQANSEQLLLRLGNDAKSSFSNIAVIDRTANTGDTLNLVFTTLQHNGIAIITQTELDALEDKNRIDVGGGAFFNADTTLANVTSTIAVEANTNYAVSGVIWGSQNVGKVKFALNLDQTPSDTGFLYYKAIDETGNEFESFQSNAETTVSLNSLTDTENFFIKFEATFVTHASTAGTIALQAAQSISSANSTFIHSGTWIAVKKNV